MLPKHLGRGAQALGRVVEVPSRRAALLPAQKRTLLPAQKRTLPYFVPKSGGYTPTLSILYVFLVY